MTVFLMQSENFRFSQQRATFIPYVKWKKKNKSILLNVQQNGYLRTDMVREKEI